MKRKQNKDKLSSRINKAFHNTFSNEETTKERKEMVKNYE
jgi:hypothetical protein